MSSGGLEEKEVDGSKDVEGNFASGQMRVYEGFIEEKIKKAREQGLFKNVKGRGKPIPRDEEEGNPFISREDFLINRLVFLINFGISVHETTRNRGGHCQ